MGTPIDQFGSTQQKLLRYMLSHPEGVSVEALASKLDISKNASRQHVNTLERDGYIIKGEMRPTTTRPQQLYCLSASGKSLFPRKYSFLAELLIHQMKNTIGSEKLESMMRDMGRNAGEQLLSPSSANSKEERLIKLVDVMQELGYEAHKSPTNDETIIAHNCVFHHLAAEHPEVCEFDLSLMELATGASVEHQECMVRGGQVCRFLVKDTPQKS